MSFGLVGIAALVLIVVVLALVFSGGRGAGGIAAVLGLLVLGAAGFFFFSYRAPPAPVAVAVATPKASAAATPSDADAAPVRTIRGRVLLGAEGEVPFADAEVDALSWPGGVTFQFYKATRSGADGAFVLEGVPVADLRLHARRDGYAGAAVKVEAASKEDVVLRLVKGAKVEGKVIDRESEAPIAGAVVSWGESTYATTEPDGGFVLDPVEIGRASLRVRAKGYARHVQSISVPEAGRKDAVIKLRPAAALSGTVLGPDGAPSAGARIEVESVLDSPLMNGVGVPTGIDDLVSGPDGKYVLEDAPAKRKLKLTARSEIAISEPVEVEPLEKGAARDGVDLVLRPAAAFLATVLDDKGAPVAGATVRVTPMAESEGMNMGFISARVSVGEDDRRTDARGFLRVGPVAAGPVKVRASKDDYRPAETTTVAAAGSETPITLTLPAGVAVHGKVVDASGAPVPAASVTVTRMAQGSFQREARVAGADGTFRVGGLEGRPFMLRAEKAGYVPTSLNSVEPGTEAVVTLNLGGTIVGTAVDPEGAPVVKFRVLAKRQGEAGANPRDWQRFQGAMTGTAFEDAGGKFRLEGLEPGNYELEARAENLAPGKAAGIAVQAAQETRVVLTMARGLELTGTVVRKADGSPVAGARVKIPAEGFFGEFDMGDPSEMGFDQMEEVGGDDVAQARETMNAFAKANAVTGGDGRFTFRGLETGSVRLMVSSKSLAPATVRGIEVPSPKEVRIELGEEAGIEGTVTDPEGRPKKGMRIMLQRIPVFMRFGTTDDQGHYRIGGVAAGSYLFYVMDPAAMGGGSLNMKSESVLLEEGKTVRKDHKFGEGTKIAGRVTRGGKPAQGLMVMLFPASRSGGPMGMLTGGGGGGFAMGTSRDDGSYEITGVGPGRYTVSIQGGMGGGAPSAGATIDVPKDASEVRHDIALPEYGLHGVVVDEDGRPVVGAAVTAIEVGRDLTKLSDLGSALESMGGQDYTDDEGRFTIENMKAVPYKLQVQAEGFESGGVDSVTAVEGGPDVRVALKRGIEISVKVVGPEGTPVRGASVFLADAEGRDLSNLRGFDAVRTGDDGRVQVKAPTGNIKFEAVAPGFAPGETVSAVPAAGEIVVRLPKGAGVRATVKDGGGQPVAGAGVELVGADGRPYGQRISMDSVADLLGGSATGTDGVWVKKDLPAGPWKIRAALPDGRTVEDSVTLVEGETVQVALTIR